MCTHMGKTFIPVRLECDREEPPEDDDDDDDDACAWGAWSNCVKYVKASL